MEQNVQPRGLGTTIRDILGMIRFSHTLFALPFALTSAVLAWREEPFRWLDLLGILACMVTARSAAMAFNRLADRHYDAANPRTAMRHLPAGRLSVASVWLFTLGSGIAFVGSTCLFILSNDNWLPLYLSVPVMLFACTYSLAKRFMPFTHVWLGAALMLAPVAAWIAITGTLAWTPVVLGLIVLFWVAGFDVLYACQDAEFDRAHGLRSLPAWLGVKNGLRLAMLSHLIMVVWLAVLWWVAGLGILYLIGVAAVAVLLTYEHWLVRPDDLSRVNLAFFNVNSVISVGLFLLVAIDTWLSSGSSGSFT